VLLLVVVVVVSMVVVVGMTQIAHTNRNLHNYVYSSHVLRAGNITFVITSPYLSQPIGVEVTKNKTPNPTLDPERIKKFVNQHGNGVGALAISVADVRAAIAVVESNGGTSMCACVCLGCVLIEKQLPKKHH
jgi:4-hydroxyphenylpyruvate dioxygenase-like putative hemolysin